MINLESRLQELGTKSRLLLQVHDELVLEVVESERETVEGAVRMAMMSAADLKVPLSVSVGFGSNWDAAAH
jgi:DNA polymerase-1